MRALCGLPQGTGRFLPCGIGANHCRLRHIGWEEWPRENSSVAFLNELLVLFMYRAIFFNALLSGVLPLRCCATRFACRVPTWCLPFWEIVAGLITEGREEVGLVHVAPVLMLMWMLFLEELEAIGLEDLEGFGGESDQAGKLQRILRIKMIWVSNLVPVYGRDGGLVIIT